MSPKIDYKNTELRKQVLAAVLTFVVVVAGLWVVSNMNIAAGAGEYETGTASISDLVASESTRVGNDTGPVLVSSDSPYYALIATPVTMYYEKSGEVNANPLLVVNSASPSKSPLRFMEDYGLPEATSIGDVGPLSQYNFKINLSIDQGNVEDTSLAVAKTYWTKTDGAILIKDDNDGYRMGTGYNTAVSVVVLASYLDIPVIVTDSVDKKIARNLKDLNVKYTIVCGNMPGYKKVMHFDDIDQPDTWENVIDTTKGVIEQRLGKNVSYIAMANPLDTTKKEVEDSVEYNFKGEITNSDAAAYPGAAPANSNDNPIQYFNIPADYKYANVCLDLKIDLTGERLGDLSGARCYAFVGVDGNEDGMIDESTPEDKLSFFGGTPAYEDIGYSPGNAITQPDQYGHLYVEIPFYNEVDTNGNPIVKHAVQLLARLPTDKDYTAEYTLSIKVEKLADPTYPLMPDLSSMASYLAAFRMGVVMARPSYQVHDAGYIGCSGCGIPAENKDALDNANMEAWAVKRDLDYVLGKLSGIKVEVKEHKVNGQIERYIPDDQRKALAEYYDGLDLDKRPMLGIIADTNMIPQYYYISNGQGDATEGFGIPSDIFYQDLDVSSDRTKAPLSIDGSDPQFELAAGRVDGWDAQDVSGLIARTFFYKDIIDHVVGPRNNGLYPQMAAEWKNSGYTTIGTEPPVGAAITTADKTAKMFEAAGFKVREDRLVMQDEGRRQRAGAYYESANFIYLCAHGFYYWYVPTAVEGNYGVAPAIGAGGAFDVAHVKEMSFGPSVIWASSCVTGRIDGLPGRLCLSQAFLHSGMNAYVGATRESWGGLVPMPDAESGEKFGDLMALYFYGHLTGHMYNKAGGMSSFGPADLTTGQALLLAKNEYVQQDGSDGHGSVDDTTEEFILHGDPAFNPYEPEHNG